jgi:uncharacterized protein
MANVSEPGGARQPSLRSLETDACMRLVGERGIGRFVFRSERGPVAFPVNYAVADGDLFFRTSPESGLAAEVPDAPVSFEVDHWNESTRSGWSVLITGRVQRVGEDAEPELWSDGPTPWPAGDHSVLLHLIPLQVSGRALGG